MEKMYILLKRFPLGPD